ncbi:TetR/AcrR family transcriptional regulator [Sphingomonas molluscorum]|uniref:TetR/AcrR family transcriptional regulator n=1 Tax=Sphingomonas molluscorum TaxID=418184 RepID=UPI00234A5F50
MEQFKPSEPRRRLQPRSPKGGRPTQQVAAQLHEHILDAALEEFTRSGVERFSMERVAASAKISKRTLYERFKSKNNLAVATANYGIEKLARPVIDGCSQGSVRDKILFATRSMLDISLTDRVRGLEALIYWIVDNGLHKDASTSPLAIDTGTKMLESILAEAFEEPEECRFLAKHLYEVLVTIPRLRIIRLDSLADTPECKDEYAQRVLALLSRGIPALAD